MILKLTRISKAASQEGFTMIASIPSSHNLETPMLRKQNKSKQPLEIGGQIEI